MFEFFYVVACLVVAVVAVLAAKGFFRPLQGSDSTKEAPAKNFFLVVGGHRINVWNKPLYDFRENPPYYLDPPLHELNLEGGDEGRDSLGEGNLWDIKKDVRCMEQEGYVPDLQSVGDRKVYSLVFVDLRGGEDKPCHIAIRRMADREGVPSFKIEMIPIPPPQPKCSISVEGWEE